MMFILLTGIRTWDNLVPVQGWSGEIAAGSVATGIENILRQAMRSRLSTLMSPPSAH